MATPNELVAALEQARYALCVNHDANRLIEYELRSPPSGSDYCMQEIAKIDAVLKSYYKGEE